MGLTIYIATDKPGPDKYRFYEDDGIKGKWLRPYVKCRNIDDGMSAIHITKYLNLCPEWDVVYSINNERGLSNCWTKEQHEHFLEALRFYAKHDPKSMITMDW